MVSGCDMVIESRTSTDRKVVFQFVMVWVNLSCLPGREYSVVFCINDKENSGLRLLCWRKASAQQDGLEECFI